jgi:hypothetical protein
MKVSLHFKLGVGVLLFFSGVMAICFVWTPLKVKYNVTVLESAKPCFFRG